MNYDQMKTNLCFLVAAILPSACIDSKANAPAERASLSVYATQPEEIDATFMFEARPSEGRIWRSLTASEDTRASSGLNMRIRPGEALVVRTSYVTGSTTLAFTETVLNPENNFAYTIHAEVSADDPTEYCTGCIELKTAEVEGYEADALRLWTYTSFEAMDGSIVF